MSSVRLEIEAVSPGNGVRFFAQAQGSGSFEYITELLTGMWLLFIHFFTGFQTQHNGVHQVISGTRYQEFEFVDALAVNTNAFCGSKNHLRAKFCNNCGASLPEERARKDMQGRMKLHADIAHPINADCRKKIQEKVIAAFEIELEKSKQPGYKPVDMDEPDDEVPEVI